MMYIEGVKDIEILWKKYRELLRKYHLDNPEGALKLHRK